MFFCLGCNFLVVFQGGVFIDLMSMDKIVEVNTSDFNCTVEPGVTHETLNQHLHATGLWFPGGMFAPICQTTRFKENLFLTFWAYFEMIVEITDVGGDVSICGMTATSRSGTNAARYGAMAQNVLNMQVPFCVQLVNFKS